MRSVPSRTADTANRRARVSALLGRQLLEQLGFALRCQADGELLPLFCRTLVLPVERVAHRGLETAEAQALLHGARRTDEQRTGERTIRWQPDRNFAFRHHPVLLNE